MRSGADIILISQRSSSSLQSEWDPVRDSMLNASLLVSTCSHHLCDTNFVLLRNASVIPVHRSIEDRRTPGRRLHKEVVGVTY